MTKPQLNVAWWAGLTVDHLFEDCPNRTRAEASLRECGWWDVHNHSGIDPEGTDVCGLCLHRYRRSVPVRVGHPEDGEQADA